MHQHVHDLVKAWKHFETILCTYWRQKCASNDYFTWFLLLRENKSINKILQNKIWLPYKLFIISEAIKTVCYYQVTYELQSESHSIVCLNVNELLSQSRRHIWSLSNSNDIRTENHLVRKGTLNHLAKLAKWLSCVEGTYLYGAFEYMLLLCHVWVSEFIHIAQFAWMLRNSLLEAGAISEV